MKFQTYQQFCQDTSLHGWSHVSNANKTFAKVLWGLVLLVFNCTAIVLTVLSFMEFLDSTTVLGVKTTTGSIKDIVFPDLSFCNIDQIQASSLAEMGIKTEEDLDYLMSEFVDGRENDLNTEEKSKFATIDKALEMYSPKEVLINLAQNCTDMFLMAEWKQHKTKLFVDNIGKVFNDFGVCCPFISSYEFEGQRYLDWNEVTYEEKIKLQSPGNAVSGVPWGLTMLLDVETFNHRDHRMTSTGWKVWVGDTRSRAYLAYSGFYIVPGKTTQVVQTLFRLH